MSKKFSIAEWLKWSKLNIHYYCTTSLEASAMGIENLAFRSNFNDKYFVNTPYLFSHKFESLGGVEKYIKKILKKKNKIKKKKNIEKYIYNFYAENSYQKIIEEIKNYQNKIIVKIMITNRDKLVKKKILNLKFVFKNFGNTLIIKRPICLTKN